jgi:hypothetical protein
MDNNGDVLMVYIVSKVDLKIDVNELFRGEFLKRKPHLIAVMLSRDPT